MSARATRRLVNRRVELRSPPAFPWNSVHGIAWAYSRGTMTSAPRMGPLPVDETPQVMLPDVGILRSSLSARLRSAAAKNRDMIATVATSFGVFWIFAIQGVFMARLLGPEKRAEYGTAVLYTQALTYIGLLGTLLSIGAHAARHSAGLRNLRRAAIGVGTVTGVATALLVVVLAATALPSSKAFLAPLCLVCAFTLPFDHIRLTLLAVDHGTGAFSKYNRNVFVNAAILPVALCVFWTAGIRSIEWVVGATLLVPVLSLVYR